MNKMLSGPTKIVTEQTHPKNPLVNSNEKNPLKAKKKVREGNINFQDQKMYRKEALEYSRFLFGVVFKKFSVVCLNVYD